MGVGTPSVCLELQNHQNRKKNTMVRVILNVELGEILRAFTAEAKNEGFRLRIPKNLKAIPGAPRAKRNERTKDLHRKIHRLSQDHTGFQDAEVLGGSVPASPETAMQSMSSPRRFYISPRAI